MQYLGSRATDMTLLMSTPRSHKAPNTLWSFRAFVARPVHSVIGHNNYISHIHIDIFQQQQLQQYALFVPLYIWNKPCRCLEPFKLKLWNFLSYNKLISTYRKPPFKYTVDISLIENISNEMNKAMFSWI